MAHPWPMGGTTGRVSLEQGIGLTGVSRGSPGRRPGDERSHAPDYYFIIYKINPSARDPPVPGFLDPSGPRSHLFSSRSFVSRKIYSWTLSLRRTTAPPRKLFWVLGCWGRCLSEGWLRPWCGWCRQSTNAPPLSLSPALRSLHGRPGCSGSIDLPTSCPSLSLPLSPRR